MSEMTVRQTDRLKQHIEAQLSPVYKKIRQLNDLINPPMRAHCQEYKGQNSGERNCKLAPSPQHVFSQFVNILLHILLYNLLELLGCILDRRKGRHGNLVALQVRAGNRYYLMTRLKHSYWQPDSGP